MKICTKCRGKFPAMLEYFHKNSRSKDGLYYLCKSCYSIHRKQWRNIDKFREYARQYASDWRKANPDKNAARNRRWVRRHPEIAKSIKKRERENNAEYYKSYKKKHYQENKEHITRKNEEWRKNNRDKWNATSRIRCRNRRAKLSNAIGNHDQKDVIEQYDRQNGKCFWCSKIVGNSYHVDHVIPVSRGGPNDPSNLVISCPHCNESKGNKLPHEWDGTNRLL